MCKLMGLFCLCIFLDKFSIQLSLNREKAMACLDRFT